MHVGTCSCTGIAIEGKKKNSVEILEFVERHVELIKGSEITVLWVFKDAVFS